jgi:PAS domain S-box-containing protein
VGTARPFRDLPLRWTDTCFQSLLDALPDAVLVVNQLGKIVVANAQAEKIFGYCRKELLGRFVESLIPPKFRDRHALDREQYLRDPHVRPMGIGLELFAQRSNGTDFPVEINLSPITTEAGTFVISSIRDATALHRLSELKKWETVLRETYESEARFRLAADFAPVMIWMSGTNKLCTYFNEPWLDFTGRSLDQERGNGWAEGVHPDDLQRVLETYSHAFDRREEVKMEYRLRRCDGEYRWIFDKGVPRFNADHSFAGYIGSCVDVTEVKWMEKALRQKEMDLLEAQRLAGVGSWHWDVGNDTVTWSKELYRIAGRDSALPVPTYKEHSNLFTAESWDRLSRAVEETLRAGTPYELDLEMVRPDGTTRWIRSRGEAQRDNTGSIVRLRGTAQDITDRKQTEKELSGVSGRLLEAQEQERRRIARDLHDDISQRLALMVNDMGGLENDLPDSAAEARRRIHEIGERASEICSDIQDISHQLHSSKLQYLGIAAAARIFCKEFSEHEKLKIDFNSVDIPPVVPENISLCLFRVLQESLHNAAKHSGASHLEVHLRGLSSEILLTICDRGVGFDPEAVMKRNGLGLISIRERVGLVGGTFSILSKPQSGTEISVRVPISVGEQASRAAR